MALAASALAPSATTPFVPCVLADDSGRALLTRATSVFSPEPRADRLLAGRPAHAPDPLAPLPETASPGLEDTLDLTFREELLLVLCAVCYVGHPLHHVSSKEF